ncbi:MAG: radical SAM protein [Desulfamplus sp.]|nr:radical SAM protein [Desulfamplus sp.]
MILIYPPVAKISEPPPGVAILSGALKEHGIDCKVIDANIEGMLWLARSSVALCSLSASESSILVSQSKVDSWSRRAITHFDRNISELKDIRLYKNIAKYRQKVIDLNKVISIAPGSRFKVSISDYTDSNLTPVKSQDLLISASEYKENLFYPFFESHLAQEIEAHSARKIETHPAQEIETHLAQEIETHSARKIQTHPAQTIEAYQDREPQNKKSEDHYIGISLCYLSQALTSFALVGWIRARFPEKKIVMGGGLVTSWMSMPTWNDPFKGLVDCMVKGRGEEPLISLCGGGGISLLPDLEVEQICRRPDLSKRSNLKAKQSYRPNFDFCNWDQYIAPGRILPFRTVSGCYWNKCRFCPEKAEGNRYSPEKNRNLLENLCHLVHKYQPDYIHFIDDAIPPSFLKALVSQNTVSKNPVLQNTVSNDSISQNMSFPFFKWYGFVRFTKELADPEFCHALYRSGCRLLKLGLESGDQAVLDKMEKGTDLNLASKVLTCLKNAGIQTYVYLLFGTQFEDEIAAEKTLDYVLCHSDQISFLNLAIFNLPRFSEDAKTLQTKMISEGDLSLYLSFKHPMDWDRKKVRIFLDKKFKKQFLIRDILKHDPPFFTSNHAMFVV